MTPIGYIQFPRQILAKPWAQKDSEALHVFLHLLCEAAYEPRQEVFAGKAITLQPGQLVTGRERIAKITSVNPSKVQRILKKLERYGEIEQQTSNASRLISISCATMRTTIEQRTAPAQQPANINEQRPTLPGSSDFELLKRIGKAAAKLWVEGNAAKLFDTPAHADKALEWLEHICRKNKPLSSQQELSALVQQFKGRSLADLATVTAYSYQGGYTALYFDNLNRLKNKQNGKTHIHLDTNKPKAFTTTDSGLKILK